MTPAPGSERLASVAPRPAEPTRDGAKVEPLPAAPRIVTDAVRALVASGSGGEVAAPFTISPSRPPATEAPVPASEGVPTGSACVPSLPTPSVEGAGNASDEAGDAADEAGNAADEAGNAADEEDSPAPMSTLDRELEILSEQARRRRRRLVLIAAATGVGVSVAILGLVAWGAEGRAASAPSSPAAVAESRPEALPVATSPILVAPATVAIASASGPVSAPATGVGLSAAMKAALDGGAQQGTAVTTVTVRSSPPGAVLFHGDKRIGSGSAELELRSGERARVLALLNHHVPTSVTIDGSRREVVIVLPVRAPAARRPSGGAVTAPPPKPERDASGDPSPAPSLPPEYEASAPMPVEPIEDPEPLVEPGSR